MIQMATSKYITENSDIRFSMIFHYFVFDFLQYSEVDSSSKRHAKEIYL